MPKLQLHHIGCCISGSTTRLDALLLLLLLLLLFVVLLLFHLLGWMDDGTEGWTESFMKNDHDVL
jgi:hypothetical protein